MMIITFATLLSLVYLSYSNIIVASPITTITFHSHPLKRTNLTPTLHLRQPEPNQLNAPSGQK